MFLKKTLFVMLSALLLSDFSYAQKIQFEPILPFKVYPPKDIKNFVNRSMEDPALRKRKPKNKKAFAILLKTTKGMEASLKKAKKSTQGSLAYKILRNYAALSYFYDGEKPRVNINKKVLEYAGVVVSLSKEKPAIIAEYYRLIANFVLNYDQKLSVNHIPKLIANKFLPTPLKNRLKFLKAKWDLDRGGKNWKALKGVMYDLSDYGLLTSRLTLARFYAGIDGAGVKARQSNVSYKKELFGASDKVHLLSGKDKKRVFRFITSVWRMAEGDMASWSKPPINEVRFKKYNWLEPIRERHFLQMMVKGDYPRVADGYKGMARKKTLKKYALKLKKRAIDVEIQHFNKNRQYASLETYLNQVFKTYEKSKNKAEVQLREYAIKTYRYVWDGLSKQAMDPKAQPPFRTAVIAVGDRYLGVTPSLGEKVRVWEIQAQLYVLNKEFKSAVGKYLALSDLSKDPKNKEKYLRKALPSQLLVANWPSQIPWYVSIKGDPKERATLAVIYEKIHNLIGKKVDWEVDANLGLVLIAINKKNKAFDIWKKSVVAMGKHKNAQLASGYMVDDYYRSKSWQNLEDLTRNLLKMKVVAIHKNNKLPLVTLLGTALYEGGRQLLAAQKFKEATPKLREFADKFNMPQKDHGYLLLAQSLRGEKEFKKAFDRLVSFTEIFLKSKYLKSGVLMGCDWTAGSGIEELAIYFHNFFLANFRSDKEFSRIADNLVELFESRRLLDEAIETLKITVGNPKVTQKQKVDALHKILKLSVASNQSNQALEYADKVLLSKPTLLQVRDALMTKARILGKREKVAEVKAVLKSFKKFASIPNVAQYISEIQYILAEIQIKGFLADLNGPRVSDPIDEVYENYKGYEKSRDQYLKACEDPETQYCVISLFRINRLGEQFAEILGEFRIPETAEDKKIEKFLKWQKITKDKLLSSISGSDKRAFNLAERSPLIPRWHKQLMWKSNYDWDFYPVYGASGRAYIQWNFKKGEEKADK